MAAAQALSLSRAIARGWDRITPSLPVVLMATLALLTYMLARQTPGLLEPRPARAPGSDPDYFLKDFSIKTFDDQGRLRSELQGSAGRHFPDVDVIEVERPRIRAYNLRGEPTVATAQRALSNGDGTQVQLIGDAVVVREATGSGPGARQRLEIRSEFLHVYTETEQLRTDKPVQILRGADRYSGDRLAFSNLDQQLQLQGRVRASIAGRRP
jgi:lipopolysaccharide export system protein LptC